MQGNSTRTGNPAFRQGLLFGITLGIFFIVFNVTKVGTLLAGALNLSSTGTGALISIVALIAAILAYLFAGIRASQQTGGVGTGALAGLWTGLISSVITWVDTLVFFYATHGGANQLLFQIAIFGTLSIALALVLGTGIGAIGGLVGKRRASLPTQVSQ